jgi:hypothetical protein
MKKLILFGFLGLLIVGTSADWLWPRCVSCQGH